MSPILLGYAVFSFGLSLFLLVLWLQSYVVLSSLSHLNPVFHSPVICSHSAKSCRMVFQECIYHIMVDMRVPQIEMVNCKFQANRQNDTLQPHGTTFKILKHA